MSEEMHGDRLGRWSNADTFGPLCSCAQCGTFVRHHKSTRFVEMFLRMPSAGRACDPLLRDLVAVVAVQVQVGVKVVGLMGCMVTCSRNSQS